VLDSVSSFTEINLQNIETLYTTKSRDPRIVPPLIDIEKQRVAMREICDVLIHQTHSYKPYVFVNVRSVLNLLQRTLTRTPADTLVEIVVRYLHENHQNGLKSGLALPVDLQERLNNYKDPELIFGGYFLPHIYRYMAPEDRFGSLSLD